MTQDFFYDESKLAGLKNIKIELPCAIQEDIYLPSGFEIGAYSYIGKDSIIYSNLKIGRYCSIAPRASLSAPAHPKTWLSTSPFQYGDFWCSKKNIISKPSLYIENTKKRGSRTEIGNDVLIYTNAIISCGVKIGDGAIIWPNSVVTENIPPYSIVSGTPAKVIGYRFEKELIEKLLDFKWWELDLEKIKSSINWENPEEAIDQIKSLKLSKFEPKIIQK
jgi:virginiamycin A acetyltransferase